MSTALKHYVNQSVPEAAALLQGDEGITFSVLANILQIPCAHIFTDHENIIICHSSPPYPVWIWCRDNRNPGYAAEIGACLRTYLPAEAGYVWNISQTLVETMCAQDPYFSTLSPVMGLISYRMDELLPATHTCDGYFEPARAADMDLLCKLWHDACLEMEGFDHSPEICRNRVLHYLEDGKLLTWRNDAGELVAMTSRGDTAPYSKVATVYTLPEHRRKGYAMNLVHAVSAGMMRDGLIPILYTDANYPASNACYQKIGFRQVDSLITLGRKPEDKA